ncbi:hypothetical protein GCM10023086_76650 [Streptomyces venetus]|uniref:Uncharacterized protein n=1 Tax=Streptomyces venetus TaxID=1701086 RepID=A0ABP8HL07_9ACTN
MNGVAPDAGLSVTARSYGPLMTAQLISPVSGSDFAAELLITETCDSQASCSPPFFLSGPCPPRERIRDFALCLRVVEQGCSGLRRERWGYAAANAEAAAAAAHPLALRWLWATACDYARRAAEGSANAPVHPMRWSSRTSG